MVPKTLFLLFVTIIDTKQSAGKGGGFAEGYKEGLVDLTEGFNIDSAEEQNEASKGEDGGGDELYVKLVFHIFFWIILGHFGLIKLLVNCC